MISSYLNINGQADNRLLKGLTADTNSESGVSSLLPGLMDDRIRTVYRKDAWHRSIQGGCT
jgi:hypothetical protein